MPGFGIDEISGLNFVHELVELNLPPVVFESAGTPSLHLTGCGPRSSRGPVDEPGQLVVAQDYASVGAQVDLRFGSCTGTT